MKTIAGVETAVYLGTANVKTESPLGDRVTEVLATVELPKLTLYETIELAGRTVPLIVLMVTIPLTVSARL